MKPILRRAFQVLLLGLGLGLLVWALLDPRFRDTENNLSAAFILPFSAGIAMLMMGLFAVGQWRRFAFWFGLGIIGQAAALQIIEAGNTIGYQHYKPFDRLFDASSTPFLLIIALQSALVLVSLARHWSQIWTWARRNFKLWQLVAIGGVFVLSSATVSVQVSRYTGELLMASFIQAINLANIILVAWAVPDGALASIKGWLDEFFGQSENGLASDQRLLDRFALLAALWVTVVAALLSFFVYEQHPHIPDEVAYLYQARFFADGDLTKPAPPTPEAFDFYLMQFQGDQWYPSPPPGWPLMLTVGTLAGVPWLVNAVLAGLNILLIYLFLQEIFDQRLARMVVFLLCVSPWYLFMGMNFMTHTFTLTCALIAALGVTQSRRTGRIGWAWVAGAALGAMALTRPLEGAIMAGLLGLWAIGVGGSRLRLPAIFGLVVGAILIGSLSLLYNAQLTGDPRVFPIMAYTDERFGPNANALGFGPDRGMNWPIDPYPGHSPRDALINANLNTFSINIELFGWSTGSLIFVALFLFAGKLRKADYLMLAVIAAVFGVHIFYYFSGGPDFGARYWFLMVIPLVVFTVRGIQLMESKLTGDGAVTPNNDARVWVAVFALCVMALLNFLPWRSVDKYHNYLNMRPDMAVLAKMEDFGRSLVLVRGLSHPDYASAAMFNPLDLQADGPIYAWDENPEVRASVLAAYADRPVYFVNGPTLSQDGFEVIAGPVPASALLAGEAAAP